MFRHSPSESLCRNICIEMGERLKHKNVGNVPTKLRNVVLYACVFTAVLFCLYLLMVLFATIPNHAIQKNMTSSAMYELTVDRYEIPENGSFQQVADNYADQIWLNIAWHMGSGNPFVSVLNTGYYNGGSFGVAAGLHQAVTRGQSPNISYTRYWHGSAACLRFIHLWTDIQGAKILGFFSLFALICVTLRLLFRDGHELLGMCLAVSLLTVQLWQLRLSFEYLPCFLICFGLCPAFLKLEKRGDMPLELLSVAAGVMTAFFDFLTVETITILVPLILVVTVRSMDGRLISKKDTAALLLRCLLCWGFAYAGTFAVKWIAAAQISGDIQLSEALTSAEKRLGGTVLVNGVETRPGMMLSIGANLSVFFGGTDRTSYNKITSSLFLCGVIIFVFIRGYRTRRIISRGTGFILTLGSLVLVRYAVLANHSYLHAFFTYRALLSTILAVLTAMMLNLRPPRKKRRL